VKHAVLAFALATTACGGDPPIVRVDPPTPSGRPSLRGSTPLSPRIANYRLDVSLDPGAKLLTGKGTLTWRHTGAQPVTALPFHLYMNAFKNRQSVFMRESGGQLRGNEMDEDGEDWGWIELTSLSIGGKDLRPGARFGEDESTLTVPLAQPIAPGETVTIELVWKTRLPKAFARTGWKGQHFMVGQWFPKIGVLLSKDGVDRWHCDTFHANSEFFADFGVYDVTLDVPDTHVVVATGVLTSVKDEAGRRRHSYHAEDVHDFVWMADPWMKILSGKIDDVDVHVVYRPEQAAFAPRHLEAARRTIETYSRLFYPYPWTSMTVIDPPHDAAGATGGMEYPNVVTTAADIDLDGLYLPELVTIHEVGHNWFQGLLASNEVDEAWLDEGVNEYTNGIVHDAWFGEATSTLDRAGMHLGYYAQHAADQTPAVKPVRTRSYEFAPGEYGSLTYGGPTRALRTVESMVGRDRVHAALGTYARKFAFQHPTGDDFLAVMETELGAPAATFLRAALGTTAVPNYRILKIKDGEKPDDPHEIVVANVGQLAVPVDVEIRFTDGHVETRRWNGEGFARYLIPRAAPPASVSIDPKQAILLEQERFDNARDTEPTPGPALQATSRGTFWAQTLLQLVGP
jgi:Peptidase family M1 domain